MSGKFRELAETLVSQSLDEDSDSNFTIHDHSGDILSKRNTLSGAKKAAEDLLKGGKHGDHVRIRGHGVYSGHDIHSRMKLGKCVHS